jgi:hypothetical protein
VSPAKPIGRVATARRVRLVVDLPEVEGLQLAALARHLGRSEGELVVDAVRDLLAAVPREGSG